MSWRKGFSKMPRVISLYLLSYCLIAPHQAVAAEPVVTRAEYIALESRVSDNAVKSDWQNRDALETGRNLGARIDEVIATSQEGVLILGRIEGQGNARHDAVLSLLRQGQTDGRMRDATLNNHESRISAVEQWGVMSKWLVGICVTIFGTILTILFKKNNDN